VKFEIAKLIIWPRDVSKGRREVCFVPGKVNVVTGDSQTGKSSIIPIVDYCLAGGKCTIPVGKIREKSEWFGVQIITATGVMILARREPGENEQSTEMYMTEGQDIVLPERPFKNCNVDAVKSRLNEMAGLSSISLGTEEQNKGFGTRASFRDLAAFEFQPQHIVANPNTLFFKADTYEHRERLKYIFPLTLGAIDNDTLSSKRELESLERDLGLRTRELNGQKAAINAWLGEVRAYFSRAKEFGLIDPGTEPQPNWSAHDYLAKLRQAHTRAQDVSTLSALPVDGDATARVAKELAGLKNEERELSHHLSTKRYKLSQMEELKTSASMFIDSMNTLTVRAEPIGWFEGKVKDLSACPLCHSESQAAKIRIMRLSDAAKQVARSSDTASKSTTLLDKDIIELRSELRQLELRLNVVRRHRGLIEDKSQPDREARQRTYEVYKFVGMLEQALASIENARPDSDLEKLISDLSQAIASLRARISSVDERKKLESNLEKISSLISAYTSTVGVESPSSRVSLDIKNLTLRVATAPGRNDYLWEIGSGANWMGYHVASMLALHEFFLSQAASPVPNHVVFDQPSQVYFPEGIPAVAIEKGAAQVVKKTIEDIERVKRIFQTLSNSIERTKARLQIIVIDHADANTWEGVDHIHCVERWREGRALIPTDW
jgi:predicted  nucleic acid-binding Zn-ribbon protein